MSEIPDEAVRGVDRPQAAREEMAPDAPTDRGSRAGRISAVDGVRAIAFLFVLVYHTGQFAGPTAAQRLPFGIRQLAEHGTSGVDIFIVLSGFCLFLPVVNRAKTFTARGFWRKRIRRIVPAYYASIVYVILLPEVLVLVYKVLGQAAHWQHPPGFFDVVTHLTFTHMLFPQTWDGINGSYWSLGLEAQFYVLMPVLVWLYARWGAKAIAIPVGISLGWNLVLFALWHADHGFVVSHFLWGATAPGRWLEFGAGMAAAYLAVRRRDLISEHGTWLGWLGVAGILLDIVFVDSLNAGPLRLVILGVSTAVLLLAASGDRGRVARALSWRPLGLLGLTSYSFYLLHQPTEYYFAQLLHRFNLSEMTVWVLELSIGFCLLAIMAATSYWLFERQYLRSRTHQHGLADVAPSTS